MKKIGLIILFVLLAFSCKNSIDNKISKKGYGVINFTSTSRTVQAAFDNENLTSISLYGKGKENDNFSLMKVWDTYDEFVSDSLAIKAGEYKFYITAECNNMEFKSEEEDLTVEENFTYRITFELFITQINDGNKGTVQINYKFEITYEVIDNDIPTIIINPIPVKAGSFELNKITYKSNTRIEEPVVDIDPDVFEVTPYNSDTGNAASATFIAELDPGVYELISRFEMEMDGEAMVAVYPTTIHVLEGECSSKEINVSDFNPYYEIYYYKEDNLCEFSEENVPNRYSIYDEIPIEKFPSLENDGDFEFQYWYTNTDSVKKFDGLSAYECAGSLNLYAKMHLNSDYLLFSEDNSSYTYNIMLTDQLNPSISNDTSVSANRIQAIVTGNEGIYYLEKNDEVGCYIKNSNDGYYSLVIPDVQSSDFYNFHLYYDHESDLLYGLNLNATDTSLTLFKMDLETNNCTTFNLVEGDYSGSIFYATSDYHDFAVFEDKLYISCKMGEITGVDLFKINETNNTMSHVTTTTLGGVALYSNFPSGMLISDMLFMDGKLYALWNTPSTSGTRINADTATNDYSFYSYGGIICIENSETTGTTQINITKLTDDPSITGIFSINKPYDSYDGPDSINVSYYDFEDTESENLFGPQKFIAIKPKKLIFVDEGYFIYKDDQDGGIGKFDNVNRVIEFDLDKKTITSIVNFENINFSKDTAENIGIYSGYNIINNN